MGFAGQLRGIMQTFNYNLDKEMNKAQPILRDISNFGIPKHGFIDFAVHNYGATITDVVANPIDDFSITISNTFPTGQRRSIHIKHDPEKIMINFIFELIYTDALCERRSQFYEFCIKPLEIKVIKYDQEETGPM